MLYDNMENMTYDELEAYTYDQLEQDVTIYMDGVNSVDTDRTNYATPEASCQSIFTHAVSETTYKYAHLAGMTLDGTYHPIEGDIGWWSSELSGVDGIFTTPIVIQLQKADTLQTVRLVGDTVEDIYPTNFTIRAYEADILVFSKDVTDNTSAVYEFNLTSTIDIDNLYITILNINKSDIQCRFSNVFQPHKISRTIDATLDITPSSVASLFNGIKSLVRLDLTAETEIYTVNTFGRTKDLNLTANTESIPTNVHTRMSDDVRSTYGKLLVNYSNPLADVLIQSTSSDIAYNAVFDQLFDGKTNEGAAKYFTLYDNKLNGSYFPANTKSLVGWKSNNVSNSSYEFETSTYVAYNCSARLLLGFDIYFDIAHNIYLTDFTIRITKDDESYTEWTVNNHTSTKYSYTTKESDVVQVKITALKNSEINYPAVITEITTNATVLYEQDDLMSFDLLEELTYEDTIGALGGVSSNEIVCYISNENEEFYFNSISSLISKQLKKNRRLQPFLGTDVIPNTIEWYPLGTFWSYSWEVPVGKLIAKVTAFDSIGLLNTLPFTDHQVYIDYTLVQLFEVIFNSAQSVFPELAWNIDSSLSAIIIPVAWFVKASYMQALKRLAGGALVDVYCDRYGVIQVKKKRLEATLTVSNWTDDTNVIDKSYPTLYSEVPNQVVVNVLTVSQSTQEVLNYATSFSVDGSLEQEFVYSYPAVGSLSFNIVSSGVTYTYVSYSWGIILTFSGTGTVTSIQINATALITENNVAVTKQNDDSIILNGTNTITIDSPMIQTIDRATLLANSILDLAAEEIYTTDVDYRGDISLTLNDAIVMENGIAPTNKYLIARHTLTWDGALIGTARLNT